MFMGALGHADSFAEMRRIVYTALEATSSGRYPVLWDGIDDREAYVALCRNYTDTGGVRYPPGDLGLTRRVDTDGTGRRPDRPVAPGPPATNPGRRSPRTAAWTGHPGTATVRLGADRDRLAEGAVPHRRWSGEPRQQGRCELICCLQMYLHL